VETEVCAHPDVREAAAIGVASDLSEDEVMIVVAAVPGRSIDHVHLASFLMKRMPYFMVPRYIRVVDELPKTPSAKVRKADLRKEGVTSDTWDREAAGMRARRETLS
jgi:crotonobetaine/carnitine-CoA ligase